MEEIIFAPGSVPVAVVARVYGKDASWVRAGIISGWLPIGKATRNGKLITNIEEISKYGDFEWFISDDPYIPKPKLEDFMNIPEDADEEIPFN